MDSQEYVSAAEFRSDVHNYRYFDTSWRQSLVTGTGVGQYTVKG